MHAPKNTRDPVNIENVKSNYNNNTNNNNTNNNNKIVKMLTTISCTVFISIY